MKKWTCLMVLGLLGTLLGSPTVLAESDMERGQAAVCASETVLQRLERLEQQAGIRSTASAAHLPPASTASEIERPEPRHEAAAPRVDMDKTSRAKIFGRWAGGYQSSKSKGPNPNGSFGIPEAKVVLRFEPNPTNALQFRLNLNNATFNNLDLCYLETDWQKQSRGKHQFITRIGRQKFEFGEEAAANNPVESVLVTNSAGHVAVTDEGLQLYGRFGSRDEWAMAASLGNANSGVGADNSANKSVHGKLSFNPPTPLSFSMSWYDSGDLGRGLGDLTIAGLASAPALAQEWNRKAWELDLRYDYRKGKVSTPATCDSKAYVRAAWGVLTDQVETIGVADRTARYSFIEGKIQLDPRLYSAARWSRIRLDSGALALLNGVTANEYRRVSFGFGYRCFHRVTLKVAYDWNKQAGNLVNDLADDQLSLLMTTIF